MRLPNILFFSVGMMLLYITFQHLCLQKNEIKLLFLKKKRQNKQGCIEKKRTADSYLSVWFYFWCHQRHLVNKLIFSKLNMDHNCSTIAQAYSCNTHLRAGSTLQVTGWWMDLKELAATCGAVKCHSINERTEHSWNLLINSDGSSDCQPPESPRGEEEEDKSINRNKNSTNAT